MCASANRYRIKNKTPMFRLRFFAAILALLTVSTTLSAEITFKRAPQYNRDTVFNSRYYMVGITDPGNLAAVNGEQVRVYKTGAFGRELKLQPGDNPIEVTLFQGTNVETKKFNIYYETARRGGFDRPAPEPKLEERLFYVETKENAALQYGTGTDRLGGSKMGYLDPGIVLKVTGEYANLYKVQLSANRYAYIQKEDVELSAKSGRCVNTNNIGMSNQEDFDRIRLSLPVRLPYASRTELDPTTIVVEVFGAMNNSNWVTQYNEFGMVDYVDLQQVDSDVLQLVIKLKDKYAWGYRIDYEGTNLIVDVRHAPAGLPSVKGLKIGLDAGHGGSAPGAISPTGINEKDVNLNIVFELKKILEKKGATVVLSRPDDRDISMTERKKIFRDADIDLMFSVHNNAGGSPLVPMGTSTYYKHIVNRELAATVLKHMMELNVPCFGLTGNFNFSLNAPTEYPNALVECLFMSSLPDEEMLADPATAKLIAEKITAGLEEYLQKVADSKGIKTEKKKKK